MMTSYAGFDFCNNNACPLKERCKRHEKEAIKQFLTYYVSAFFKPNTDNTCNHFVK